MSKLLDIDLNNDIYDNNSDSNNKLNNIEKFYKNSEYILNKSIFDPLKHNKKNDWKNRLDKRINKYYYSLLNIE